MKNLNKFTYVPGSKNKTDKILLFNNVAVAFEDVALMCLFFMENEDNLYPPTKGYRGAEMFKDYIKETLETRKIPQDKQYSIKKRRTKV